MPPAFQTPTFQPFADATSIIEIPAVYRRKVESLYVVGCAMPWERPSNNVQHGRRDLLMPGAFRDSLREIQAGRRVLPIFEEHREDERPLMTSEDDGLSLADEAGGLWLKIDANYRNRKANNLAEWVRRHPESAYLSASYRPRETSFATVRGVEVLRIETADLVEVSLVESPGMGRENCRIFITKMLPS
jgi:HK97 family phage prohead protease